MEKFCNSFILASTAIAAALLLASCNGGSMTETSLHDLMLANGYESITLTRTQVGHFAMKGSVNGKSAVFLLDTGASSSVLDKSTADSMGLQTEAFDTLGGGLGATGMQTLKAGIHHLDLGTFRTGLDSVYVMDLATVNKALVDNGAEPVDGVIGADVLLSGEAVIDYAKAVLYIRQGR
jgi:clan AA aspartic protease (TIGR02281 family)